MTQGKVWTSTSVSCATARQRPTSTPWTSLAFGTTRIAAAPLVDLPWLAVETVELLKTRGYNLIEIDYSEREALACNVLSLGEKRLLALEENSKTNEKLRQAGFDVRSFPGSELCINGSGGRRA